MNENEIKKYKELMDKFKENKIIIIGKEKKIEGIDIKPNEEENEKC